MGVVSAAKPSYVCKDCWECAEANAETLDIADVLAEYRASLTDHCIDEGALAAAGIDF